jgi:NitT/TauT family transport system ATP-binding protein
VKSLSSALTVEQLSIVYTMTRTQQSLCAVQDVSFSIARGEFVALIGPSGCGKTSILQALGGLQPLSHGRIRFDDQVMHGPVSQCATVFQAPALLPWRSVLGNAAYGLELRGVKPRDARPRAQAYVDLVGLRGFEQSYPHELSGGMQQRTNLARALAVEPGVILFDEPLAALDEQTRESLRQEVQRIWLQRRFTALFVTHQVSEAIFLADRIIVMSSAPGRIQAILPVPMPRPRSLSTMRSEIAAAIEDEIRGFLAGSVSSSAQRDE